MAADTVNAYSYTNSKGQTYYLHKRDVTLKNGRVQTIYFFARDVRDGAIEQVPEGYEVVETKRTGMPVLRKIRTEE
jgi:hypothetical protein